MLRASGQSNGLFATLAHELRNPLSPIANGLQLLKLADGDWGLVRETTEIMERQVELLSRLVDDIVDLSRLRRHKLELHVVPTELRSIVSQTVESSRSLLDEAHLALHVSHPERSLPIEADPRRIAQALRILLSNASRYTERGGRVDVTVERREGQALVRVQDTGTGIAPEMLPYVFDVYAPQAPSRERRGGLGIGLALARGIVELHGGSLTAASAGEGLGSRFELRLPLPPDPDHSSEGIPVLSESAAHRLQGPARRILVVDDNQDAAQSLAITLRRAGREVKTVYDGQSAVDEASRFQPDAVLLDIGMPRMNGYEACRRIRERPGGDRLMLIAVTSWGQNEDKRKALEAGFDHHFTKPVRAEDLVRVLSPR